MYCLFGLVWQQLNRQNWNRILISKQFSTKMCSSDNFASIFDLLLSFWLCKSNALWTGLMFAFTNLQIRYRILTPESKTQPATHSTQYTHTNTDFCSLVMWKSGFLCLFDQMDAIYINCCFVWLLLSQFSRLRCTHIGISEIIESTSAFSNSSFHKKKRNNSKWWTKNRVAQLVNISELMRTLEKKMQQFFLLLQILLS